ncbi:DUF2309 domain-containing protein [Robiginitalea sp. SC105]|nr:DUF2309 domain-containing protein [Robiginitalea sp. SC105]
MSLSQRILEASEVVGKTWPLYAFVTSNPLTGYEKSPFKEALSKAAGIFGARVYPEPELFRKAWENGEIHPDILLPILREHGMKDTPEHYLKQLVADPGQSPETGSQELDRITAKWVMAFLDEGLAEWAMPGKKHGFYKAWRRLAGYDQDLAGLRKRDMPETAEGALGEILSDYPEDAWMEILTCHLAALPGWTGYIKFREEARTAWQEKYPISLEDYLAVRLLIAKSLEAPILPPKTDRRADEAGEILPYLWLTAWERSWQQQLVRSLAEGVSSVDAERVGDTLADAQLVFCIDTRSEPIRRHIEQQGNYETHGYAGFFGIAMDYEHPKDGLLRKSCPPILGSAYKVREVPAADRDDSFEAYLKKRQTSGFIHYFLRRMKNMLPSAFGYVEGAGVFYGGLILARTWLPGSLDRLIRRNQPAHEAICEPQITQRVQGHVHADTTDIPLAEKVAIVKSAFDLMGWREFAPLVVFAGHGSHSTNNPFASSLDCGACAASPGRHNARMLARLANQREVRRVLIQEHGLIIPEATVFIGAEHNTTTDEILLFDTEVPGTHKGLLDKVKRDLDRARESAVQERLQLEKPDVSAALRRAGDWSETRPEWGLAGNAGFVIGPRSLTKTHNLGGRCFLHSYQWELDPEGKALEGIMQGPMVVTQWINNHYFFATVDPERFGGGDKITHNITGQFGVLRGNGGDLKSGLPLQSLYQSDTEAYHQPLRLSVCIQAPKKRVGEILSKNPSLQTLLDNQWIYLIVLDPRDGDTWKYSQNLKWDRFDAASKPSKKPKFREAVFAETEMA